MKNSIVILGTLDTKGREIEFLRQRIVQCGCLPIVFDMGVVGTASISADYTRAQIAKTGGTPLTELLGTPSREVASPVMIRGASTVLQRLIANNAAQAVVGIGGTQGTSSGCAVMQTLPYGFPKLMVSTCAAGDTSTFVGVKDITMMFSVSDILGLNPFMRTVLSNAAAAVCGMANQPQPDQVRAGSIKATIGITNLGVLTDGATFALDYFEERGFEAILFHAVGAGGRAMEQMMRDGLIHGVFDYALGEIADEVFHGLRAGGADRLTTAGKLGLPQVICPGGAEHIGIFLQEAFQLPEQYSAHQNVFHSPVIAAPRLMPDQLEKVAEEIGLRLGQTKGNARFMIPLRGVSRYSVAGGPLHNPNSDARFFAALKRSLPASIDVSEIDAGVEDPVFVKSCCDDLIEMMTTTSTR